MQTLTTETATHSSKTTTDSQTGTSNFAGCLRKIVFTGDNIRLDLLSLLHKHNQPQHHHHHGLENSDVSGGSVFKFFGSNNRQNHRSHSASMTCEETDAADPITFTTADSFLKLPGWNSPKEGTISLKIRTNEPNGVLLYTTGTPTNEGNVSHRDFFGLELLNGHVMLILNLGSSTIKVKSSNKRIDDSQWHSIHVVRNEKQGHIIVDQHKNDFISPGTNTHLDLDDSIYLGGFPKYTSNRLTFHPPEFWSASLFNGFIGCVKQFSINNRLQDIVKYAEKQDSGGVKPSCHSSTAQCATAATTSGSPCQNGGTCHDGWNRFVCDCSSTGYTGSVCAKSKLS